MHARFKYFKYCGAATLARADDEGSDAILVGKAILTGQFARKRIPVGKGKTIEGIIEFIALSGGFTATTDIPPGFLPSVFQSGKRHRLMLTDPSGLGFNLLCRVERMEDTKRSIQILDAGYNNLG